jgi:hypothetical protein
LLLLAGELEVSGDALAERYLSAARRNLECVWLSKLWHEPSHTLWDAEGVPSFVPNKAATFIDAVLLLHRFTSEERLLEHFAIPTGDHILSMQVSHRGHVLDGAIAQNRFGERVVESYFPLYIARCIPALFQLASVTGEKRFREGALHAAAFVGRVREPDGGSPQVLYARGRRNRNPRWVAGAGDVVRSLGLARQHGSDVDPTPTVAWVLRGVRPDGRIATAQGFDRVTPLISRRDRVADEMGVVGWSDKAFRALAPLASPEHLQPLVIQQAECLQERHFSRIVR